MVLPHSSSTVAQGNNGLGVLQAWPDGDGDEAKEHRRQLLLGQLWVTKEALAKACGASCVASNGKRPVYGVRARNMAVANGLRAAAVLAPLPELDGEGKVRKWATIGNRLKALLYPKLDKAIGRVGGQEARLWQDGLRGRLVLPADLGKIAFVPVPQQTGRNRTGLDLPQKEG